MMGWFIIQLVLCRHRIPIKLQARPYSIKRIVCALLPINKQFTCNCFLGTLSFSYLLQNLVSLDFKPLWQYEKETTLFFFISAQATSAPPNLLARGSLGTNPFQPHLQPHHPKANHNLESQSSGDTYSGPN